MSKAPIDMMLDKVEWVSIPDDARGREDEAMD